MAGPSRSHGACAAGERVSAVCAKVGSCGRRTTCCRPGRGRRSATCPGSRAVHAQLAARTRPAIAVCVSACVLRGVVAREHALGTLWAGTASHRRCGARRSPPTARPRRRGPGCRRDAALQSSRCGPGRVSCRPHARPPRPAAAASERGRVRGLCRAQHNRRATHRKLLDERLGVRHGARKAQGAHAVRALEPAVDGGGDGGACRAGVNAERAPGRNRSGATHGR